MQRAVRTAPYARAALAHNITLRFSRYRFARAASASWQHMRRRSQQQAQRAVNKYLLLAARAFRGIASSGARRIINGALASAAQQRVWQRKAAKHM